MALVQRPIEVLQLYDGAQVLGKPTAVAANRRSKHSARPWAIAFQQANRTSIERSLRESSGLNSWLRICSLLEEIIFGPTPKKELEDGHFPFVSGSQIRPC